MFFTLHRHSIESLQQAGKVCISPLIENETDLERENILSSK